MNTQWGAMGWFLYLLHVLFLTPPDLRTCCTCEKPPLRLEYQFFAFVCLNAFFWLTFNLWFFFSFPQMCFNFFLNLDVKSSVYLLPFILRSWSNSKAWNFLLALAIFYIIVVLLSLFSKWLIIVVLILL